MAGDDHIGQQIIGSYGEGEAVLDKEVRKILCEDDTQVET